MSLQAITVARLFRLPGLAVLLGLSISGCGINNIPSYQETAKAKWSDVQNQYQRRADLVPNLVETVKGYAKQEREVLEAVTAARLVHPGIVAIFDAGSKSAVRMPFACMRLAMRRTSFASMPQLVGPFAIAATRTGSSLV